MKIINLNTGRGIQKVTFPDSQPHINIPDLREGDEIKVICSITSSDLLLQLLECADAIDNAFAKKKILIIPYLMGARYDRLMHPGDSIDLKVIAKMINSMAFEKVYLFDVHSEASTLLIHNAVAVSNKELVASYQQPNTVLICPDAGAAKKVAEYAEWNENLSEIIYCNKHRDLSNGKITLKVLEPEKCTNRNCVIIDDICDGGGTFIAIAEQIKPAHLTLVVTHGIFSKGFEILERYFNEIIVSDSYRKEYQSNITKVINIDYENL